MRARQVLLLAAAACATAAVARAQGQRSVAVAVAANMKPAFEEIAARFRKSSGVEVRATYGASGHFFAQIANGAPFDLFLSADAELPARAVERGLADGAAFSYAYGKLVVWVPNDSKVDLAGEGLAALAHPSVQKIAIANPDLAPYGRAAKVALERAGLYQRLADRIVVGESVSQAAQFVQSGNAQAGFLPLSLARAPPLSDEGRAWPVPRSSYERIEQAGIVVKGAKGAALARQFAAFLAGGGANDILEKFGYGLLER